MSFPTQAECDLSKPEEHFLWALRGLEWGNSVSVIPRPILEKWSRHLVEVGAVHVLALHDLANEDGFIHVSDLPVQRKKYVVSSRGEDHPLNGAGQWVDVSQPEPEPRVLPPVAALSPDEKREVAESLRQEGYL